MRTISWGRYWVQYGTDDGIPKYETRILAI